MSQSLIVFARLIAKPGKADIVGDSLKKLIGPTRSEPGCLNYVLHRDNMNPNVWILYEAWKSLADLDAHFQQPYMRDLLSRAPDLLEGEVKLTTASIVSHPPGDEA